MTDTEALARSIMEAAADSGEVFGIKLTLVCGMEVYRKATVSRNQNGKFDLHFIGEEEPNVVS